jgi:hypothetical protein
MALAHYLSDYFYEDEDEEDTAATPRTGWVHVRPDQSDAGPGTDEPMVQVYVTVDGTDDRPALVPKHSVLEVSV